jgi:hypothetical protein
LTTQRPDQQPPFPEYLAELPTAADEWERASVFMSIWLGCASATLAVALLTFNLLGSAGAACAVIAAATHRYARLRQNLGLADAINRVLRLAIAAASLCGFVSVACILIALGLLVR